MNRLATAAAAVSLVSSVASAQLVGVEWRNPLLGNSNQDLYPRFFEMRNLDSPSSAFADPFIWTEEVPTTHAFGLTVRDGAYYYLSRNEFRQSDRARVDLVRFDANTETFTTIGDTGLGGDFASDHMSYGGLAYNASNSTFYALRSTDDGQVSLHTLDAVTGAASLIGNVAVSQGSDIAFDGAGNLYLVENTGFTSDSLLHTIDITNGQVLTTVTLTEPVAIREAGLAINTRTGEAYLGTAGSGNALYEVDLLTGVLTRRGDFDDLLKNGGNQAGPGGLVFVPAPGAGVLALMSGVLVARRRR